MRVISRLLSVLALTCAVLAVLLAGLAVATMFPSGRAAIAALASWAISATTEIDLNIEGVDRLTPVAIDLQRARVAMRGQEIATAEGVHLRLRWTDLLRARLRPSLVHVERLAIEALPPPGDEEDPSDEPESIRIALPLLPAEEIRLDHVVIAERVLGEAVELRASATETDTSAAYAIEADLQRLDRPGDSATLRALYHLDEATLDIRLVASEAPAGILARRIGANPQTGLHAELVGTGPLAVWRGRLTASLDGVAAITAELGTDGGAGLISGDARIEPAFLPELAPLLHDPIRYQARLRWSQSAGLQIESSRFDIGDIVLGVAGRAAADFTRVDLQLSGDLSLAALAAFVDRPVEGLAGLLFHVSGPPMRPAIVGDLALSEPRFGPIGSANAILRLEARPDPEGRYRLAVGGNLAGVSGAPPALAPFVAGQIDLDAELAVNAALDEIQISRFALRSALMSAEGDGVLRPVAGESRGRGSLRADMSPGIGPVTGGHARLELRGSGDLSAGKFRTDGDMRFEDLALSDAALGRVLGAAPRVSATVSGATGTPLRLDQVRLQLAAGDAAARGTFDASADSLDMDVTATIPDLNRFSELVGQILSGRVEITAHVTGPSGDPAARGEIAVAELALGSQRFERGGLSFDLRRLASEPQGPVAATVHSGGAEHRFSTNARLRDQTQLELAQLVAATAGLTASGDLTLDLAKPLARGRVNLLATDLAPAASMAGLPLKGRGQASLRLDNAGERQHLAADFRAEDLHFADVALGRLEARARIEDALGTPHGEVSVAGRDLRIQDASLSRWQLAAKGGLTRATFDLSLSGDAGGAISARANGTAGVEDGRWQVILRSFEAQHRDVAMRLDGATELRGDSDGGLRLASTELTIGKSQIRLGGGIEKGQVDAQLRAGAFPLSLVRSVRPGLPIDGHIEVQMSASGPAAEPRIAGRLRSNDLKLPRSEGDVAVDLEFKLVDGRMAGHATIGRLAERPLVATATVPIQLGILPWRFALPPDGPIEGRLDGNVDLARVLPPLIPEGDRVRGVADVQAVLRGTLSRPEVSGTVKMSGGRYENAVAEATIADLALDLAATGESVTLAVRGSDGRQGSFTLEGRLSHLGTEQSVAGKLALRDFWVARRPDASVRMAGEVNLAGTMTAPRLVGNLAILQADLHLPEQLPPQVVNLHVVEVNGPVNGRPAAAPLPTPTTDPTFEIGLDLTITADRRVFVRGRGLESEWRGNLHLRGDTAQPDVSGTLEAISGRLDFLGERFVLTRGRLMFPGGARIDPDLDLATELSRGDLTAIVKVVGTLRSPQLILSARPDLPPEEVVSRILFQKGTARLSPLQAVQVAQSLLTLTGHGGGPGVVDRMRRATGLDVIDFQPGEGEGAAGALAVGRYLSDNVLLRAEKGFDNTGPRVGVEVEVTPNISIESKVGSDAATSVGVKLKKDY